MSDQIRLHDDTPLTVYLLLATAGADSSRRVCELVRRTEGLVVRRPGEVFVSATATVKNLERIFGTKFQLVNGELLWEPKVPDGWRELVTDVALPPSVEFAV